MWTSTPAFVPADLFCEIGHRLVDEHGLRVGIIDDVDDLVGREMGVHRAVVQPGKLAAPGDLEEFRTVRQHERDAVARPQPGLVQQGGDTLTPGVQLAVRDGPVIRNDQGRRFRGPDRMVGDVHSKPLYETAPSADAAAWRFAISDGSTLSLNTR